MLNNKYFRTAVSSTIEDVSYTTEEGRFRDVDAVREISQVLSVFSLPVFWEYKSIELSLRGISKIDKPFTASTTKNPRDQLFQSLFYGRISSKLIRLLPIDLEKVWDAMIEVRKNYQDVGK
jgi:hypothetical protein